MKFFNNIMPAGASDKIQKAKVISMIESYAEAIPPTDVRL